MNFEGRYYTENSTLVAVHKATNPTRGESWKGHELMTSPPKQQPLEYDPVREFLWDENGNCIWVMGYAGDTRVFNLSRIVNPMTYSNKMKVEGCVECTAWEQRL